MRGGSSTGSEVVLASAVRSATANSADIGNQAASAAHIIVDLTAMSLAGTLTPTIQGKDETSGKYYTILAGAAIAAVSTVVLRVGLGMAAAANVVANDFLPGTWRVNVVQGGTGTVTYSVGVMYGP